MINDILIILWCLFSVFLDIRYKKIPNLIAYSATSIAVLSNTILFSYQGLLDSIIGFTVGILISLIPYKLNACDYGEFKILAFIGTLCGYKFVLLTCILSCIFIISTYIVQLILCGKFKSIILNANTYFQLLMEYDVDISVIIEDNFTTIYIPYSIIIFLSALLLIII